MAGTIGFDGTGSGISLTTASEHKALVDATVTYTAVADDVVSELGVYIGSYTGDGSGVEVGVYNMTAGISGAPLVSSAVVSGLTAWARNAVSVTPFSLVTGDLYCVAVRSLSATTLSVQSAYLGSGLRRSTFLGSSPLQPTFTVASSQDAKYSIFATVTTAAAAGPVITGPASLTEGTTDNIDGTGFDIVTVDIQLAGDDASAIAQVVSAQTSTTATITPRNSVTEPTLAVPVAALPPTVVDLAAAGSTAQSLEVVVTNGDASTDTNPVTLATPSTERSIRALTTGVDAAVTTAGSVFDTAIIAVEDNMTAIVPKQVALSVGSADIALTADGVYSYSSVDGDVDEGFDIPIKFWSPTTKQESTATITVIGVAADTAPTLPADEGVNVAEGNTAVGNTSTATAGTAPITYTKSGTDQASFNINSSTGALTFITAPDYETKTSYTVNVIGTNAFGSDSQTITVNVTNANEQTIVDGGNGTGEYPNGDSGLLKTGSLFTDWIALFTNATGNNSNLLPATLTAGGSPYSVTFTLDDADDLIRTFTATEQAQVSPTGISLSSSNVGVDDGANAVVGTLSTVDANVNDTHTYSLVSGTGSTNNASFNISGNQLRAVNSTTLGVGTYSVRIQTTDGSSTPYSQAFSVNVVDVMPSNTTGISGTIERCVMLIVSPSPIN